MLDFNKDMVHLFKVAIKGSEAALQRAYRRSIRTLAECDIEFGPDSQPDDLEFRWEWIAGYRVLTIQTDGAGIHADFSDIEGLTEVIWAFYNDHISSYESNDAQGVMLKHRDLFRLPDGEVEIYPDSTSAVDGTLSFDPDNPNVLNVE